MMPETRAKAYQWFKNKYSILAMILPAKFLSFMPRIGSVLTIVNQRVCYPLSAPFFMKLEKN